MQFILRKASDLDFRREIEINSMGELEALSAWYGGHNIVVKFDPWVDELIIYDDYIE